MLIPNSSQAIFVEYMVTALWYIHIPNFGPLSWFQRCKKHPCPLSPDFGHWWRLEDPDGSFTSWSLFGYDRWSLIYPHYKDWLSIFILKVQRTYTSFKSWFGALEDAGDSWLVFGNFTLIWIWLLVFGTLIFRILSLYLDFEGAKNIHVL